MNKKRRFIYGVSTVFPSCIIGAFANFVGILTLGYYVPSWEIKFMGWSMLRRWRKNENNNCRK